jgi:hypothetical protein
VDEPFLWPAADCSNPTRICPSGLRVSPQFEGVAEQSTRITPLNHLIAHVTDCLYISQTIGLVMVRLVFRPYTQIRRSICTSEPLLASTCVSAGFTISRHSSPSFGSNRARSYSDPSSKNPDRSMVQLAHPTSIHFHSALGFNTQTLASVINSLVRVSRRVV